MELSTAVKEKLISGETKMRIALDLGISYISLSNWLRANHSNLTKLETIAAISRHTGIAQEDLFKNTAE